MTNATSGGSQIWVSTPDTGKTMSIAFATPVIRRRPGRGKRFNLPACSSLLPTGK
jgi:hypothetical protein